MSPNAHQYLALPPIPLQSLPESTKDFILASSHSGKTPAEVVREILERAAVAAGFRTPTPQS